ncbi:MAG: dicarboxylate/amino acid:cation symporter [Paludibacteraceae bacterium]|jgi:Na+/H+-dicarboxylate symporter|nr:dicarboxylate/amino acid:cation symporter [Paludibacteraceae bacterium]
MSNLLQNYRSTILLVLGLLLGALLGIFLPSAVPYIKPIGDIFLNLLFILIVPLVFFSIATAIYNLKQRQMVGRVLGITMIVFIVLGLIAGILTYLGCIVFNPMDATMPQWSNTTFEKQNAGELLVNTLTVSDFNLLLSKSHILPLIVFALLFGLAIASLGEKGKPMARFIESGNMVIMQIMELIMKLAPIGLGCYFASIIAQLGTQVLTGYMRMLLLFCALTLLVYFVLFPLCIYFVCGKNQLKLFFKHILSPSLTALATCSSSACMPINIISCKRMEVKDEIAETVIPLGTNLFKIGSIMNGVLKVIFAMALVGMSYESLSAGTIVVLLAFLSATVVGAIPSGGMTGEIFICALLGIDPQLVGVLMVVATIVDIPATLLNSIGNITATTLINKLTDKKS